MDVISQLSNNLGYNQSIYLSFELDQQIMGLLVSILMSGHK
ncbi:hypothetical protein SPLC1_S360090 [Arthrospira platensis C1]|uniref:Uncharacterized protein n=2 Tax=Limnospira TaxID=2596745 RepID=A0A9P1KJI0_9CYAN|nr:hypothetical protein AmaxDRAFT_0913 [Limnospira maxima CS-328]EKD07757.1 hypothetical protein SPLC1_S360090 [Arthrospira platensis C1]UWU47270.1 hypothetical protein APLC1_2023 [Arthrospira platensis C1]CDM96695.1 hypothetical protein ARTHRO_41104 [Limnospira indica PCC 8005]